MADALKLDSYCGPHIGSWEWDLKIRALHRSRTAFLDQMNQQLADLSGAGADGVAVFVLN